MDSATLFANVTIIDGGGRTLMPGLTEAHSHLSFVAATGWPRS